MGLPSEKGFKIKTSLKKPLYVLFFRASHIAQSSCPTRMDLVLPVSFRAKVRAKTPFRAANMFFFGRGGKLLIFGIIRVEFYFSCSMYVHERVNTPIFVLLWLVLWRKKSSRKSFQKFAIYDDVLCVSSH